MEQRTNRRALCFFGIVGALVVAAALSPDSPKSAPTTAPSAAQSEAVPPPPPPIIVSVMYGYERHCPIATTITSHLVNREIMLIPAKAEAQRAMAITNGDSMAAQMPNFCADAEKIFIIAIQSGQYLDEQLRGAIHCIDVRYLPDAEAFKCLRYWPPH